MTKLLYVIDVKFRCGFKKKGLKTSKPKQTAQIQETQQKNKKYFFKYGSLARIPSGSAQHRQITRGDRFATRGHPWRARFRDLWKKRMTLKKKVFWFSSKIHDKRCFNVQRHHPNQQISPTRPENVPKYKGFCIDFRSSRRYSMIIWCLCTLKHRLSWFF